MSGNRIELTIGLLLTCILGCADSIAPHDNAMADNGDSGSFVESDQESSVEESEEGELSSSGDADAESAGEGMIVEIEIDASSQDTWIHFDLDSEVEVNASDPNWDLGFQRFNIRLNGGFSGDGGVETTYSEGGTLEDDWKIPDEGWFSDVADLNDDGVPEYAFGDWYDYDVATHVLTPKLRIWFVRSTEGRVFALEIIDYYSDAGTSGFPSLRIREVN